MADTWNQRFCRFSSAGAIEGCWGGRGNLPPYGVRYPRGIAFDPVNGRVWVTNNAGGTIYVYDDVANFLFQLGSEDNRRNSLPGFFEEPFGVTFGNGYAHVTDVGTTYEGNTVKVKILDALTSVEVGSIARNAKAVAVDEATDAFRQPDRLVVRREPRRRAVQSRCARQGRRWAPRPDARLGQLHGLVTLSASGGATEGRR